MNETNSSTRAAVCIASALVLGGSFLGCKDEDPCDPGQVERSANACYDVTGGSSGFSGGNPDGGAQPDSGAAAGVDAAIGQPCVDTTASSDCGGTAPICAPLPAGSACTQASCLDGEANAGVCPPDWPCTRIPGYPSSCLKF